MKQVILRLYECRMSVQSLCRMMDKVGEGALTIDAMTLTLCCSLSLSVWGWHDYAR